jgi:hypothetical protein
MRYCLLILTALSITPSTIPAQATDTKPGAVSGHVYCADTRTPCRFASVKLHRVQADFHARKTGGKSLVPDNNSYLGLTGIDGGFLISGVAPGDYYIHGTFVGYLDPFEVVFSEVRGEDAIPLESLEKTLPRVTVSSGLTTAFDLTLARGAALGGTVRYDDGGLAGSVNIVLYRKDKTGTWKRYGDMLFAGYRMSSSYRTDDRGRFYLPGLPSGSYVVETSLPQPHLIPGVGTGFSSDGADSLRVFTGGKFRLKDAASIELRDGEDRPDIDIDIPINGLHTLQGFITSKLDGRSITKGTVSLLDPDDKSVLREADIQQDGSFGFNYVVNGSYLLQIAAKTESEEAQFDLLIAPLLVEGDMTDLAYTVSAKKR